MYERMLDKGNPPTEENIAETIGAESARRLEEIEGVLKERYRLVRELKFPFGDNYGWGYKYGHGQKHLFYLFFERGAITATIQIGGKDAEKLEHAQGGMLPRTRELWANRYPCGNGGWVHYRILEDEEIPDVLALIAIKKAPVIR
jgi:hypothetical protein